MCVAHIQPYSPPQHTHIYTETHKFKYLWIPAVDLKSLNFGGKMYQWIGEKKHSILDICQGITVWTKDEAFLFLPHSNLQMSLC